MADLNPLSWWKRFLALPNESRTKTLAMAFLVSAISALSVSFAAVVLRPIVQANLAAERQARLEAMIETLPGLAALLEETGADSFETLVVDLTTGTRVTGMDPATLDLQAVANDPETSIALTPEADIAGIARRPNLVAIHLMSTDGAPQLVILPVYGTGYQSTIRGYLALEGDMNTVAGLTITEQGETPGLGARIEEAAWQALWPGKQLADENGDILIEVVRGGASTVYQVDGITGATRTSNGVANLVRFWAGPDGYGPVLAAIEAGGF